MNKKKSAKKSVKKRLGAGIAVAVAIILLSTRMGLVSIIHQGDPPKAAELCSEAIPWREVWNAPEQYRGEVVAVKGTVATTAFISGMKGKPTFINLGNPHPRTPRFEILIWEENRPSFLAGLPAPPELQFDQQSICVAGTVELHEGVPQIEIRDPVQIMQQ
ncbi:MAG: hypothetical protein U5P10_12410 [Spirochaetia bacterium]|nr:hypothetical protein [Spirochaetia bacterium]